jgi:hypothetical protein
LRWVEYLTKSLKEERREKEKEKKIEKGGMINFS